MKSIYSTNAHAFPSFGRVVLCKLDCPFIFH